MLSWLLPLDSIKLQVCLPENKLIKLRDTLLAFKGHRKVVKKDLERLGGLLVHCAKVVRGGYTFFCREYDLMNYGRYLYYKIRLNAGFREDVRWWLGFAERFNGQAQILGIFLTVHSVYSDASKWGFAAVFGTDWLTGTFKKDDRLTLSTLIGHHHDIPSEKVCQAHINIQEMWVLFSTESRWSHLWSGKTIIFITDSSTVESAKRTGRSKCSDIMCYLQWLFWLAVGNNCLQGCIY